MPNFEFEKTALKNGHSFIAGIDEAGRGPWAGPVVAGAVILDRNKMPDHLRDGLDDSKKLSEGKRAALFDDILKCADVGIGQASVEEIDDINILQATFLAMGRAVGKLSQKPDFALIDGNKVPPLTCPAEAIVKGDGRSLSIAAASIIAKVTRDRLMAALASDFPGYGWEKNKGYGTKTHQLGLESLGVTDHHRKSYKPIINILSRQES
ncbi:MAG: ribonuclease HII [Rhodospirillaceae bacterium]|jgi:ribonuclease HII|nr:ribonuclease HII [Rhodospirillaceae bacterium]MBT4589994.1 ribonuclease HII [Rhodospirillaceae bacterium]MBT4940563.1 ribonuclease HII [Rhodospirillaceae bacterium]MBT7268968.1 ribonuclease HII [Rhodospirillaceae bacterium]